jgi:hypothetical protein
MLSILRNIDDRCLDTRSFFSRPSWRSWKHVSPTVSALSFRQDQITEVRHLSRSLIAWELEEVNRHREEIHCRDRIGNRGTGRHD